MLILDFDGTVTDAEAEGAPFRAGYLADLALLVGVDEDTVRLLAERIEREIAEDEQAFGWVFRGSIVAPANVDPYLRIMPVARRIFDHFGCFPGVLDRERLCDGILYRYNYAKSATVFRPGAREVLAGLDRSSTWVVTNSHADVVREKILRLGASENGENALAWLSERVFGRAQKYLIDDDLHAVPASLPVPGLQRPVLLRRRVYFERLDALRQEQGVGWEDVLVVGDIFELDLSLPLALGARVALMAGPFTPDYERAFVAGHPRGHVLQSLAELKGLVGG